MNEKWWQAILQSDPQYDNVFIYGVVTTKIFCKPSCPSKHPKRENVRIFRNVDAARQHGFRPCKRCKPEEPMWYADSEIGKKVQQLIDDRYMETWSLSRFGVALCMSPYHVHRMFSRLTGVSPAQALLKKRLEVAKHTLVRTSDSITDTALTVGFRSAAHFSSVFAKEVGCSPSEYRWTSQAEKRCKDGVMK